MATLTQAVAHYDPRLERRLRARLDAAVTRLAVMACVLGGAVMRAVGALQAAMRHDHRRGALAERRSAMAGGSADGRPAGRRCDGTTEHAEDG